MAEMLYRTEAGPGTTYEESTPRRHVRLVQTHTSLALVDEDEPELRSKILRAYAQSVRGEGRPWSVVREELHRDD